MCVHLPPGALLIAAGLYIMAVSSGRLSAQEPGPQIYPAAMSEDYNPLLWTGDNARLAREMIQESRCEAELSNIASTKSSSMRVQRLAGSIAQVESRIHRQFVGMARTINFHLGHKKDAPPCHPAERIAELRGNDLDTAYLEYVSRRNAAEISTLNAELELLTDPQNYNLRQAAKKDIPVLVEQSKEIALVQSELQTGKE
jgi:Domain of unknown function (DUF4142)